MANLELAAAFGAADAAKEQDLRGYYPMAARVLAEEVRRLKAERDAIAREAHTWSKAAETYAAHEADAKRLQQLFGNLLENAVRYTDAGGMLLIQLAAALLNWCVASQVRLSAVASAESMVEWCP